METDNLTIPSSRLLPASSRDAWDVLLVELAVSGDRNAREKLAVACLPRVRRLVYMAYGGKEDTDDVVQIAMVAVFRDLCQLRASAGFRFWMDRVVFNVIRSSGRKRNRLLRLFSTVDPERLEQADRRSSEEAMANRELFYLLQRHLLGLAENKRMAAVLSLFFGYVDSEIAQLMNCGVEAAKKRTQHGRRELFLRLRKDPAYTDLIKEVLQ